jgi:Fe-S oxidoreductase
MERSKRLIGYTLASLKDNFARTRDPLGLTRTYWAGWSEGCGFALDGKTVLITGRMYQMLPYIRQATRMIPTARRVLALAGAVRVMPVIGRWTTDPILRLLAGRQGGFHRRGRDVLQGIAAGLQCAACQPVYRPELDCYGGALLYDLGLQEEVLNHLAKILADFRQRGISEIVTIDPHTTQMFKIATAAGGEGAIRVRNYLEVLDDLPSWSLSVHGTGLPETFVIHDSCVLTRDLGIDDSAHRIAERLGITLIRPESSGRDTACCGGPIEYAFPELSMQVAGLRARELADAGKNVLVACPICLLNLSRHEKDYGMRVWDFGEVLGAAAAAGKA